VINYLVLFLRRRIFIELRRWTEKYAIFFLKRRSCLWLNLINYTEKTGSTGCNMTDYYVLYKQIRDKKPIEVLECGTGVSTLVIAHALMENERETGKQGHVTSMEEIAEWGDMAEDLLPDVYRSLVDIVVSPAIEDYYGLFRGMRYRDIPERDYDFVFVDGPKYRSPYDNHPTFDFDYLHILRNSNIPVSGLIDQRVSTVFVLQQLLGKEKIKYSPSLGLGYIAACTRSDLGQLAQSLSSSNFVPSFRVVRPSQLYIAQNE
jgi:hypothetical protein